MPPRKRIQLCAILLATGLLGVWWWKTGGRPPSPPSVRADSQGKPRSPIPPGVDPVTAAFRRFPERPLRAEALDSLARLSEKLAALPKRDAVAWVRAFLANGEDKTTGLSFVIGSQGVLQEWPTYRTFLIDQLLAIDPVAAAAISREILAKPTTADEWALALRNVGKADSSGATEEINRFLVVKTEELIANPAWQAEPSIGYLNAFDVLVAANATASTPMLSGLIQRKDRRDLAHAGFLTLDRLVQRQPADLLDRLYRDQALQKSRPEMVAQQFARADVRVPAQREILKAWLLDPARTPDELRAFAGVYPNNNRFVSNNLLTIESSQAGADLAAHDRAALEIINAWVADPLFQPVIPHLRSMSERLRGFVSAVNQPAAD